ncbi:MAG: hypothetical protein IPL96_08720 [Holophagaceae bacterium]|nr:hypothetical protein [Holophagaceae bacterium]
MLNLLLLAALTAAPADTPEPPTNTLCPVMGLKVDAKGPIAVVDGRAYRMCCGGCDKKLKADPAKYLAKDGTPKNAPKAAAGK